MPMGWAAAAVAASTLVGSYMQAKGAQNAADTYANSANAGIANQRQMFDLLNQQGTPFRQTGYC